MDFFARKRQALKFYESVYMKVSRNVAIILNGVIWMSIGMSLLYKGMHYLLPIPLQPSKYFVLMQNYVGSTEQTALLFVSIALLLGFFKGRFVLVKTVDRTLRRLYQQKEPISCVHLYPMSYLFLLGGMIGLGLLVSLLSSDVRGLVDIAIGAALANGSALYFRQLSPHGRKNYL